MEPSATPARSFSTLRNPLSLLGAALTTTVALLLLTVFVFELVGWTTHANPYLGIFIFIVLPGVLVAGLLLIPFGAWRERRRRLRRLPPALRDWPRVDLNNARTRAVLALVLLLTPVNLFIVAVSGYKGVEAMDSVAFCGQTCHQVMEPQFVAYQVGPHARVKCVTCHIGAGADWFVRSKLSGARQVYAVLMQTHSRPIPSPVDNLRPARETCEQCHWPSQFHGDKLETRQDFAADEANTQSVTTLRLRIGGVDATGQPRGIHWHVAEQNAIEYIALDRARQQIGYVKLSGPGGTVREYYAEGVTPAQLAAGERRRMDCVDCHNRPSHRFAVSPDQAVNTALASAALARDLPFVKRESVALLSASYSSKADAIAQIERQITDFYRQHYPAILDKRQPDLAQAVRTLQDIYSRNVFPDMKVTFGSYQSNVGHMDSPGCFRCHDESHKTASGAVITQDCETCHLIE